MVAYITGPLIFANIDTIEQLTERVGTCDTLLLSMRGVPYIDISAAQALMDILRSLHEKRRGYRTVRPAEQCHEYDAPLRYL